MEAVYYPESSVQQSSWGPSSLSLYDSKSLSTSLEATHTEGTQSTTRLGAIVVAIVLFLGVLALVVLLIVGSLQTDEDHTDGEVTNGDDGGQLPPVPAVIRIGGRGTTPTTPEKETESITLPVTAPPLPLTTSTEPPTTITTTTPWPEVKEIVCTVGHAAVIESMYPPEGICQYLYYTDVVVVDGKIVASLEQNSWKLFQKKATDYNMANSGVAFDHRYITPELITFAISDLNALALNKIRSYGLLNIVRKPSELSGAVRAMKPVVEALKDFQGDDPYRRTIIAVGSRDYSKSYFMSQYNDIVEEIVNTFKVDAVIAISSVGSMEDEDNCYAAPPNVLGTSMARFPSLESHWHFVRANTTYNNTKTLVGLSLEMATLIYKLKKDEYTLGQCLYARCSGFALTSRDAICGERRYIDTAAQYVDKPYMIFGTFVGNNSRNHVAFAEYFISAREKMHQARRSYGRMRHRTALLLFNVHLGDVRKKCGSDAFNVLKWVCQDLRGTPNCG